MNTVTESKDIASRSYSVSRLINAPKKLVYEVWTKPEHIKHWWGAKRFYQHYFKNGFQHKWRMDICYAWT